MVRVTLSVIILSVVSYAFLIAIIVFFLDKYLDLRVIAYTADASRQATNLLHFIVTSGCTGAVEEKLVLNLDKLNPSHFNEERWEDCSNLEYDYDFYVNSIDDSESYEVVKKLVFNFDDMCYLSYQRIKGYVEMPVALCNRWEGGEESCKAGIANLTLMKTPLSELAFWVSQASLRIKEGHDSELIKSIRVGPEVNTIDVDNDKICMTVNGVKRCKLLFIEPGQFKVCIKKVDDVEILDPKSEATDPNFKCDDENNLPKSLTLDPRCKIINVYANATNNKFEIIIPVI